MTRIIKVLSITGLSSVYLMQGTCEMSGDGLSVLPNINTAFSALLTTLTT